MAKIIKATTCEKCGASSFKRIKYQGKAFLKCEYCDTLYEDNTLETHPNPEADILDRQSISGMGHTGDYVVYKRLSISGMGNTIRLCESVSKYATHVRDLSVSGMNNSINVKLMSGVSKHVSGMGNFVG